MRRTTRLPIPPPRPLLLALAVLAAHAWLMPAPARADLVVGIFSGTITSVQEPTDTYGTDRVLPDVVPAVGDHFSGVFGYHPNPAGFDSSVIGPPLPGITFAIDGQSSHSENLDFYGASFTEDNPFGPHTPPFFIEAYNGSDTLYIEFDDPRRPFPKDGAVSGVWTEADFGTRTFFANDLTSGLRYTGTIDRLTLQSAPEPAGLATFAVGGAGLVGAWAWRRWRRLRAA